MSEMYKDTLAGMRTAVFNLTRLIDACLFVLDPNGQEVAPKAGDPDVLRIVTTMIHVTGISAHSVLKLTEGIELSTRDCYPIARGIVESTINVVFILASGREAALRAERHAQQKSYRDLKRSHVGGASRIELSFQGTIDGAERERLEALAMEFTRKNGSEKRDWTDESLSSRIEVAAAMFGKKPVMMLDMAMAAVYRHSSEVIHGTYFGALFFWGATKPNAQLGKEAVLETLAEHQFGTLMATAFALSCLVECTAAYVGYPGLAELAAAEIKKLEALPLISEALAASPK